MDKKHIGKKYRIAFEENKIWLIISKHVVIALFLVVAVAFIDMEIIPANDYIPKVLLTNFELSTWILSNIATALLTITTFTFSITMVVLTTYASNYSPRIVEDFLNDKNNIKVLGVFIGGFVYSIISLLLLNNVVDEEKVISAGVSIAYSLVCVVFFVIFIFSVANSIHAQKLIAKLYNQAVRVIDDKTDTGLKIKKIDEFDVKSHNRVYEIISDGDGFIEVIKGAKLRLLLRGCDFTMVADIMIGQYVFQGQKLGTLYYTGEKIPDSVLEELSNCFILSGNRYVVNDYKFAIQKITEIGMRAFSPAVNDPNTGIHCINTLASLASKLSKINGKYTITSIKNTENNGKGELISREFDFKSDLNLMFFQLINYSKTDVTLVVALFHALYAPYRHATEENKIHIKNIIDYAYDVSINNFTNKIDIDSINKQLAKYDDPTG